MTTLALEAMIMAVLVTHRTTLASYKEFRDKGEPDIS